MDFKKLSVQAKSIVVDMLLGNILGRRAVTRSCTRNSSTTSAWNLPELHKEAIGLRTLIVSADDAQSQELTKRLWFENQKIGLEAGFYTLKTAFSTPTAVQEGLEIARRTGAKSVITIGSASVCDIGKGIQTLMEKGLKTVDELDQEVTRMTAMKDTSKIQSNNTQYNNNNRSRGVSTSTVFPHFSIASDVCPSYQKSSWSALHKEDDVLIKRQCKAPQAVVFDEEIISDANDFSSIASRSYIMAQLFDILFSHFMSLKHERENDFNSDSSNSSRNNFDDVSRIIKMVDSNNEIKSNLRRLLAPIGTETVQGPNVRILANAANAVNELEVLLKATNKLSLLQEVDEKSNEIKKENMKDESIDFSLLQTVSLILHLRSYQKNAPVPLPWLQTMIFKHCLDLTAAEKKANLNLSKLSKDEYPVVTSAIFTVDVICKIFDKTENQMLDNAKNDIKLLINSKKYVDKIKYKKNIIKSAPGEKINENNVSDGMGPGGLIEGWIVSEEMHLENLNRNPSESITLKMLKSDFLLDLTENAFKHQK